MPEGDGLLEDAELGDAVETTVLDRTADVTMGLIEVVELFGTLEVAEIAVDILITRELDGFRIELVGFVVELTAFEVELLSFKAELVDLIVEPTALTVELTAFVVELEYFRVELLVDVDEVFALEKIEELSTF